MDITHHLQCPICKNTFKHPVSTSCGHSFCQHCLKQHTSSSGQECPLCRERVQTEPSVNATLETLVREFHQGQTYNLIFYTGKTGEIPCNICPENVTFNAVKSCLTCLLSYCERHLMQHQSLERNRGHKLVSPVERMDEKACSVHGRPLDLYSRRDKQLICALCVKTGEDIATVETERARREAEQQHTIKVLESTINKSENKLEDLQNTFTKFQAQIDREQNEIKVVFAEVMDIVRRAEEELLTPLEDGRKCLEKEMAEKTQQIQNEIFKYREIIDNLNQNSKEEDDIVFLKSYPSVPAEFKHDWTVSIDTKVMFGSMRNINTAALASIRSQLEKLCSSEIRRIQRFAVDVVLDEETAHPSLVVSQDGKTVKDQGNVDNIPGGPQQFDLVGGILGKFQIASGRAFWVVEVGQKTSWELGVLRENANRRGKVSYKPSEGYWSIVLCASNLYGAFEDPPIQLHLSTKPQKVGVFVDYENAFVSFYNMDNLSHIYTFTQCSFNETLRPYFNPHPNKDGNNSHPMIICSINPVDICI